MRELFYNLRWGATFFVAAVFCINLQNKINDIEKKVKISSSCDHINKDAYAVYTYIKSKKIKYPDVVFAQCVLESGKFNSKIYKENHNLLGLKRAVQRPTTALGVKNGHAYYRSWKECIDDYALYQSTFILKINSKEEYIKYLNKNYSGTVTYGRLIIDLMQQLKPIYID